ncbi:NXPE family member 3-like [Glandiceps talaboti]
MKTFNSGYGSLGLLSISKSKLFLASRDNVRKGDYVHAVMESYDNYGNRRLRGGDFLSAVMLNKKRCTGTAGRVIDYGNGTYSIYFYAGWKGDAIITVNLIHYREGISFLNYLRGVGSKHLQWTANFTDGKLHESKTCTITNEGIWEDKCYYVNPLSLGKTALICEKPDNLPCKALSTTSHDLGFMENTTAEDIQRMSHLFRRLMKVLPHRTLQRLVQIPSTPHLHSRVMKFYDVVTIAITFTQSKLCGPDLPVTLSSGYWKDNLTFVPLMCRSQQWLEEDMEKCLLGKHLYFYGDSTLAQITRFLGPLRNANFTKKYVLLRAGSPIQAIENFIFEADYIDGIHDCHAMTPVVIMNACFHFAGWTTSAYLDRLFGIKFAVLRLLKRCPSAIVIIKLAHPRDNLTSTQSVHSANYIFYDMDRMIRRVFGGIGVRFFDIWDLVLSHSARNTIHMPMYVINQEFHLMLSYICPDMVK